MAACRTATGNHGAPAADTQRLCHSYESACTSSSSVCHKPCALQMPDVVLISSLPMPALCVRLPGMLVESPRTSTPLLTTHQPVPPQLCVAGGAVWKGAGLARWHLQGQVPGPCGEARAHALPAERACGCGWPGQPPGEAPWPLLWNEPASACDLSCAQLVLQPSSTKHAALHGACNRSNLRKRVLDLFRLAPC